MRRRRLGAVRGVRFRMAALVLLPIVPFVVLLAWQAGWVRDRAERDAETDSLRLARLAAETVTAKVRETAAVARLAVSVDASGLLDPATCADTLTQGIPAVESVTDAFVLRADGTAICRLTPAGPAMSFASRPATAAFDTTRAGTSVQPASALLSTPSLVVTQPLPRGNALAIAIDLGADLDAFVERYAIPQGATVSLLDAAGSVVGRWPTDVSTAAGGPLEIVDSIAGGSIEYSSVGRGPDGVDRVYSFVDVADTEQAVFAVVGLPTALALEPANGELRTNLLALAAIALVTLGLSTVLAERWINRHLRDIASTARLIGAGHLEARVGQRAAATELAELAATVDQMADDIQARDAALRFAWAERSQLADELLDVQEDERRRIAADIHDDTIQTVVACGMTAQLLRSHLPDLAAIEQLDQLTTRLSRATTSLRQLTFDLDPAANGLSLAQGLERYVLGALQGAPVQITVAADIDEDLQGPVRQIIFRNVREAALNAVTHGRADRLDVVVEVDGSGLRVDVVDDGAGFEDDGRGPTGHQGVRTMRHRVEALGGWFDITSTVGAGSHVSFWVPLHDTALGSHDAADRTAWRDPLHVG